MIENLTPENGTLTQTEGKYMFDFGQIAPNIPVSFKLLIKDNKHSSSQKGCGSCTTVKAEEVGNDIVLTVTFNAKGKGVFTKALNEITKTKGTITIQFTGTII